MSDEKRVRYINNHIHTTYSFSPYTPAAAVETAKKNGLETAGCMDHDSSAGSWEFIEAGRKFGMPVTVGIECRVDMSKTPLNGKLINNPDQDSIAYVTMHGIPHQNIDAVNEWLAPYRAFRNERNDAMCKNINDIVRPFGLSLDFERDVLPLSNYVIGGSVTERHITFALSKKITAQYQTPPKVVDFLCNGLNLPLDQKKTDMLLSGDKYPQYYEYDILGILKSNLVERFYVKANKECPDVRKFIDMVEEFGGISAYPYLGDVGDSVTGDKKAQKFEDDYLDELMAVIKDLGFNAVTYMPTRNSPAQLDRIMSLCEKNNFFQISGEDINSPRQSFICKAYEDPKFFHLADAAFTLIDYENAATENIADAREKFSFIFEK
ncbi:MAG: PHP domain-containing protein [Clostridiales bacterium]|jgi:hypothetical protein|nr:PHP domain-containing protein [Clostridiales bacterium]